MYYPTVILQDIVSILFTVLIPLKCTYTSLITASDTKLWGLYWAIYSFISYYTVWHPIHK